MKFLKLAVVALFCAGILPAQANDDEKTYDYELTSAGAVASQKTHCLVKVYCIGKKDKITRDTYLEAAVHGLIFKGYGASDANSNDKGKKALCPEGYDAHKLYFDTFFSSGDYKQFVQLSGGVDPSDVTKVDKKRYRMGRLVLVNYDALRKRLEKDKVVKSLDFLF